MTDVKATQYLSEAKRCQRLAREEACDEAREYYEALARDYAKLASRLEHAQE